MSGQPIKEFRLGELFCGPGGIALGASQAGVRKGREEYRVAHGWANDIDADTCQTYARNICGKPSKSVLCGPVQKLDFNKLSAIDALAFGFPCNDFSMVGERKGFNGTYGPLYSYGVKVLERFQPAWFIAENVSGLQNANSGEAFSKILADLRAAAGGYRLNTHLYRFEDYGVPQRRHRIIIVGIRSDLGLIYKVPAPTTKGQPISAYEALTKPAIPAKAANQERTKHPALTVERLEAIPQGENAWYKSLPKHLQLNVKGARLSQIYKRLHADEPAYTVTGSGGGGTHVYHWKEPRALTNRERARLQTFPDSFVFEGSKESVRKQIGMAVPPKGATIIIEAILKTFAGIPYKTAAAHWEDALTNPALTAV